MSVFIDPAQPAGSPMRYRGICGSQALASPDGLRWSRAMAAGQEASYKLPGTIPGLPGHGA